MINQERKELFAGIFSLLVIVFGGIAMFFIFPIIGIKESLLLVLNGKCDMFDLVYGILCSIAGISLTVFYMYRSASKQYEEATSKDGRNKAINKKLGVLSLVLITAIILLSIVLSYNEAVLLYAVIGIALCLIEFIYIAIGSLFMISNYVDKKLKDKKEINVNMF